MSYLTATPYLRLSPRDRSIMSYLSQHRFLTAKQLEGFCFTAHTSSVSAARSCRRVLARLTDNRIIRRLPNRQIGGWAAGSSGYVYRLAQKVVAEPVASPLFLAHTLAIADVHLELTTAAEQHYFTLRELTTEPRNWYSFTTGYGIQAILKPDLFAITAPPAVSVFEDLWFIELDRGTESTLAVRRKCEQYIAYHMSEAGQQAFPIFPLVTWLVPDTQRLRQLQAVIRQLPENQRQLFRVMRSDSFVRYLKARYYLEHMALGGIR